MGCVCDLRTKGFGPGHKQAFDLIHLSQSSGNQCLNVAQPFAEEILGPIKLKLIVGFQEFIVPFGHRRGKLADSEQLSRLFQSLSLQQNMFEEMSSNIFDYLFDGLIDMILQNSIRLVEFVGFLIGVEELFSEHFDEGGGRYRNNFVVLNYVNAICFELEEGIPFSEAFLLQANRVVLSLRLH